MLRKLPLCYPAFQIRNVETKTAEAYGGNEASVARLAIADHLAVFVFLQLHRTPLQLLQRNME